MANARVPHSGSWTFVFDIFSDTFFLCDVFVNFRTAIAVEGIGHNYSECAAAFVYCLSPFSRFRCPGCIWLNLPFVRLTKLL